MDLTKILKPGDKVFSLIHGKIIKIKSVDKDEDMPIKAANFSFNKVGSVIPSGADCLIYPSDIELTWDNYCPFNKGDIVVIFDDTSKKTIGVFSHKKDGLHYVFSTINEDELSFWGCKNCEFFDFNIKEKTA